MMNTVILKAIQNYLDGKQKSDSASLPLPLFLKAQIEVNTLLLPAGDLFDKVTIIKFREIGAGPDEQGISFGLVSNAFNQVLKLVGGLVTVLVDNLNPRLKALMVREGISFISKDGDLFLPQIYLKTKRINVSMNTALKIRQESSEALENKLIGGYLTGFLSQQKWNLDKFQAELFLNKYNGSKSTLSRVVRRFIEIGLMYEEGSGPGRLFQFNDKQIVWDYLLSNDRRQVDIKIIPSYYLDLEREYILAGESALGELTSLQGPEKKHLAITNFDYNHLKDKGAAVGDWGDPIVFYHVMKISPEVFSVNGNLNPIEVFLELKNVRDERVQISLREMLIKYDLEWSL